MESPAMLFSDEPADEVDPSQLSYSIPQSAQPRQPVVDSDKEFDDRSQHPKSPSESSTASSDASRLVTEAGDSHSAVLEVDGGGDSASRSNRFLGNPASWRRWTAAERMVATGLDDIEARDLSVHLYNLFALKKRTQDLRVSRSITSGEEAIELSWEPSPNWAAWPLHSDEVSREDLQCWPIDLETEPVFRSLALVEGPRARLQGELIAHTLRTARKSYHQVRVPDLPSLHSLPIQVSSRRQESTQSSTQVSGSASGSPAGSLLLSTPTASAPSIGSIASLRNDRAKGTADLTSSPAPFADDELASRILRPSIGHIIHQLDSLLISLHHARPKAHQGSTKSPISRSNAPSESENEHAEAFPTTAQHERSSDGQGRPCRNIEAATKARRRSQNLHSRSRKSRPGLRNWTDVLGIASMTGWDPAIIQQTASRCEDLFGQKLAFATLDERPTGLGRGTSIEDELHGAVHVDGFLQEVKSQRG